ncbi:MAG: AMP-binding protein [Dehalococcoidia bacterium]|nr:AMP-binding protein [Dehalococcoidia bacterium]
MWTRRDQHPPLTIPPSEQEHFDASEVSPPQERRRQTWERLLMVLDYAYGRLPFYKQLWRRHGVHPGHVRTPEDFALRVPVVTKRDLIAAIRAQGAAAVGIEALGRRRPANIVMTSGSEGFNTFALLGRAALEGDDLLTALRELWAMKVRPGMRVLTLGTGWHVLSLRDTLALSRLGAAVVSPWGSYTPRFYPAFLDAVLTFRPQHMLVTAPVLQGMLAECHRRGLAPQEAFHGLRYVGCAGEAITPPLRRWLCEEMGLVDFYERGGSSDGMFGGPECSAHAGHHISDDVHYVEVVDVRSGAPLPPGRRGLVVVTNLTLGRSLYVRFQTGDVGELKEGPCPCGRTMPVLELYGRLSDCLVLDSTIITPYDVRCLTDAWASLRWAAVSLSWDGEAVSVRLEGADAKAEELAEAQDALEAALGLKVRLSAVPAGVQGWKGQRMRAVGG